MMITKKQSVFRQTAMAGTAFGKATGFRAALSLFAAFCLALSACASTPMAAGIGVRVQQVEVPAAAGNANALLFTPQDSAVHPAIVVYPDLTGLRPVYADMGRALSESGYVVLVVNEFYRTVSLDGTASTAQERLDFGATMQRGGAWRAAADDAAVMADARALVAFLDGLPQVDPNVPIGVLGVDIGAAHAFIAARGARERIGSVAVVHPLSIATTRDTSPHLFVDQSEAAYWVELAASDDAREPEDKGDLRDAFANAGLAGEVTVANADHGYLVADDPAYQADIASQSWSAILAHFATTLR